jgi:bacterioferritin-associated ferredoxin
MFVCVCRAVSVTEVEKAIDDGADTVEQVTRACKAGGDCGACRNTIEEMIECRDLVKSNRKREAA